MSFTLAELRGRVQVDLDDAGAATWSTAELERAIRRALRDYSRATPYRTDGVLTVATAGREQDLLTLTGLCGVERVWFPYYSGEPDLLPTWVPFEMRPGSALFVLGSTSPEVGDKLRVYYWKLHTINGLDSATATTVPDADDDLLAMGASGYAALEKSRSAIGSVQVSGYTPVHWSRWADGRLERFGRGLDRVAARDALWSVGPVAMA